MARKTSSKEAKALFKYISLDLPDKVKAELDRGVDPNTTLDVHGYGEESALTYALGRRSPVCVRPLLDAGADVRLTVRDGLTALHAVKDVALAKELLSRGGDVNAFASGAWNATPLHSAARQKNTELVELFLAHGAKVDVAASDGRTPYAIASDVAVRALLKKHGARGFPGGGGKVVAAVVSTVELGEVDAARGAIGFDHEGRLWAGGYSGLFRVEDVTGKATRFAFPQGYAINAIAAGPKGGLYVATNAGLLGLLGDQWTLLSADNSELFDNHLVSMTAGPDHRLYLTAYEDGAEEKHIVIFDGADFTALIPGKDVPAGLELGAIAFDDSGEMVLGAKGALLRRRAGAWSVVELKSTFEATVYAIARAGTRFWIGTHQGLYELDGETLTRHAMPALTTQVVFSPTSNELWVVSGGLGRFASGTFTRLDIDRSRSEGIESLALSPDGTLWIRSGKTPLFLEGDALRELAGGAGAGAGAAAGGKPAAPPKPKKRRLVPLPAKPFLPAAKIAKPVKELIDKTKVAPAIKDALYKLLRPAIGLDVEKRKDIAVGTSKFGGKPDLPASFKWPVFKEDKDRAVPFLFQLNLAEVTALDKEGLLPKRGMLWFFSDTQPDEITQVNVLYADGAMAKKLDRRDFPADLVDRKDQENFVAQVPEFGATFFELATLPSLELLRRRIELGDEDEDRLDTLKEKLVKLANKKFPREPSRFLGWPDSLQEEVVENEKTIALFQLNGFGLSPKKVHEVFEYWVSDGLIHYLIPRAALDEAKFEKSRSAMAYT